MDAKEFMRKNEEDRRGPKTGAGQTVPLDSLVRLCENCGHPQAEHWNGRGCCQHYEAVPLTPRESYCTCSRFKLKKPNDTDEARSKTKGEL